MPAFSSFHSRLLVVSLLFFGFLLTVFLTTFCFVSSIINLGCSLFSTVSFVIIHLTILELLWATGMRVSELSGLNFENLNLENNEITVFGKGAKERIILVSERAKTYLKRYIDAARPLVTKENVISVSNRARYYWLNERGNQAGEYPFDCLFFKL